MNTAKTLFLALLLLVAIACGNKPPPTPAFVFNRPNQLELVCLDPDGDANSTNTATPFVLPFRCCAGRPALNPTAFFKDLDERNEICGTDSKPVLHALITQSARGEVAAVNLADEEVLDADPLIPGATFIDVGGLPRAIVSPPEVITETEGKIRGSAWTYVASGEDRAVRAIATCLFRQSGETCDSDAEQTADGNQTAMDGNQTAPDPSRVSLPAVPNDMVFHQGALWVSLPDAGVLARIKLGAPTTQNGKYPPFAKGDERVVYFEVPTVSDVDPGPAVLEDVAYQTGCGTDYPPAFDLALRAPSATPFVPASGSAQPSRLRVDPETGLLFVADRAQPVVHAFRIDETGTPFTQGVVKTGAPVRDFALTRPVPSVAPKPEKESGDGLPGLDANFTSTFASATTEGKSIPRFAPDERRYLYAIDDRDGSLIALLLSVDEVTQGVSSTLLLAPTIFPTQTSRADRLGFDHVATALDVIDTRSILGEYGCNPADETSYGPETETLDGQIDKLDDNITSLDEDITKLEAEIAALKKRQKELSPAEQRTLRDKEALRSTTVSTRSKKVAERIEKDRLRTRLSILKAIATENGGDYLHGVFLAVADTLGVLTIFDVHDTDVFCRFKKGCEKESESSYGDKFDQLAVRRHAVRRAFVPKRAFSVTSGGTSDRSLMALPDCQPADDGNRTSVPSMQEVLRDENNSVVLCAATDPWVPLNSTYYVQYEGAFYGAAAGTLEPGKLLRAPAGVDFCGSGVISGALGAGLDGYEGDWLVLKGSLSGSCPAPEAGFEPRMRIVDAFADHLVLDDPQVPSLAGNLSPYPRGNEKDAWTALRKCYADPIYEFRLNERYLVWDGATRLHNIVSSGEPEKRCIVDPSRDPLMTSRAKRGEFFQNPFLTLRISDQNLTTPDGRDAAGSDLNTRIQIQGVPLPKGIAIYAGSTDRTDSLPVLVRFSESTGDLMIVDSSSQGLRRFLLSPLQSDGAVYR